MPTSRINRILILTLITLAVQSLTTPPTASAADPKRLTVTDKDLPFESSVKIAKGDAAILSLPNGKEIAFWFGKGTFLDNLLDGSDVSFHWAEKPFTRLELTRRKMADGSEVCTEWKSYIRQGGVTTYSRSHDTERELFVDPYRIVLKDTGSADAPVAVQVRLATKRELLFGDAEREYFLKELKSEDPAECLEAIKELREMVEMGSTYAQDYHQVIADAIRPLSKHADPKVQTAASEALRAMGGEQELLAVLSPEPKGEWRSENGGHRAALALQRGAKPEAVIKLVLTFFDSKDDTLVLFAAAFFSTIRDERAAPKLLAACSHPSEDVRAVALTAIRSNCKEEDSVAQAKVLIKDPSKKVVLALLHENWLNRQVPSADVAKLLSSDDAELRAAAAYALDCCGDPDVVPPLLQATHDKVPAVRARAAVTLGRIQTPQAYNRLVELLADDAPQVRTEAINGLRWLRDRRAIAPIKKLLEQEKDSNVRDMAERTIRELSNY